MVSKSTRKSMDLSTSDKKKICEVHKAHPSLKQEDLTQFMVDQHKFRLVDQTTISKILCGKEKWLSVDIFVREVNVRRVRVGK